MPQDDVVIPLDRLQALCISAACLAGASPDAARSLAAATAAAEADGQTTVGLSHFFDYLESFRAGRINGSAAPALTRPAPALVAVDAEGGIPHVAADLAFDTLRSAARQFGIALLAIRNGYTCGSLGYFAGRLAEGGLLAIAAANGPAMLAGSGSRGPVFGTNPLAFAAPTGAGEALLIDQASSATAFVNVRRASERGEALPLGWAVDGAGEPTTDPMAAMRGALLAFGGSRGANVALMVEVMAAGLTGAKWSLDAPSFTEGSASPAVGLLVVALDPCLLDPDFPARVAAHLDRLAALGVHIPGQARIRRRRAAVREGISLPRALHDRLVAAASGP